MIKNNFQIRKVFSDKIKIYERIDGFAKLKLDFSGNIPYIMVIKETTFNAVQTTSISSFFEEGEKLGHKQLESSIKNIFGEEVYEEIVELYLENKEKIKNG